MLILTANISQLQLILDAVHLWSQHWGVKIGFGDDKTALMFVPASKEARLDVGRMPPLLCGGVQVRWVETYRYLGLLLRSDLKDANTIGMLDARLRYTGNRYVVYNKVVRFLSVATQRQVVQMMVLGCVNYLTAVLPLSASQIETLDPAVNRNLLALTGSPPNKPGGYLLGDTGLMPMVAVVAQNRFRLFQTLMLLRASQTPAARVVQALAEDIVAKRRSGAGDTKSWAAVVRDTLTSVRETTGLTRIPVASSPTRVHLVSARIGRLYASIRSGAP